MFRLSILAAGIFALSATNSGVAAPTLKVEARSDSMIWNAVAVDEGRVFVAGPRWTGSKGPSVGLIDSHGHPTPYPNQEWNDWKAGAGNQHAFINVNAIHLDGNGSLWIIDTGSPQFGGDPLPGGAKAVQIDLATNQVVRTIAFGPEVALSGSYVDDIRFNGRHAYLTDAGRPGLIVIDLLTGAARRVLEGHSSVTAPTDRPINVAGDIVRGADGQPLAVNADPFELSIDGQTLLYGPLSGPWSQVPTKLLDDPAIAAKTLAAAVKPWADLPPIGGSVMDTEGNLYYTELQTSSLMKRTPAGAVSTVLSVPRLHWVDAPVIDAQSRIWLPAPQMDRVPAFNQGISRVQWPVTLYSIDLKDVK
jgi:hypothetical protein